MKKIINLSLVLAASLFLSACSVTQNSNQNSEQNQNSNQEEQSESGSYSLKDLIAQGVSQKCTWSSQQDDAETSGEILVSGKKFSQTVTVKTADAEITYHNVSDGEYLYSWNDHPDLSFFALKMKLDEAETDSESTNTSSGQMNFDQTYQFNCSPAVVSDSDFTIPDDIEFADYDEFLNSF